MMSIKRLNSALRPAAVVTADVAVLVALRPAPARLTLRLAQPRQWIDAVGADSAVGTLAGAALWLVAAWVAVGLIAAFAGRLPGVAGTAAGSATQRIAAVTLPRALQRAVVGAAGLGVLLSPAVASAAAPHLGAPHPGWTAGAAAGSAVPSPLPPSTSLTPPQLPIGNIPTAHTPSAQPPGEPAPAASPPEQHVPPSADPAASRTVTVRAGDSLWRIAAEQLDSPTPGRIAAAWPRWFSANRTTIGSDPDYLVPGEVLHAPESSR